MSMIPCYGDDYCPINYGLGIHPQLHQLLQTPRTNQLLIQPGFYRHHLFPHHQIHHRDPKASVTTDKDGFQVCMDVNQYKPSEISVKTVDNVVVIEARHEERPDEHGCISRHMVRKYTLPPGYEANSVISSLSSDGVLIIKAPKKEAIAQNERVVQIQQTGPMHLNVKENKKDDAHKNGAVNGK